MADLPQPVTRTEIYLMALLDEIKGLRKDLKDSQPAPAPLEGVRVKEPAVTGKTKTR